MIGNEKPLSLGDISIILEAVLFLKALERIDRETGGSPKMKTVEEFSKVTVSRVNGPIADDKFNAAVPVANEFIN